MDDFPMLIRPYHVQDRAVVRKIYGTDEFARPKLMQKYPRTKIFLADSMSHYFDHEPESTFVAEVDGRVVGALLGTLNTEKCEHTYRRYVRPLLIRKTLLGSYGWPVFLLPVLKTHLASLRMSNPIVDLKLYPAHLHIGLLPDWRRRGIGSSLMSEFEAYLKQHKVPGYHLYASSFHPQGVAFYCKLGLEELGKFQWRFHDGMDWMDVTERIFGKTSFTIQPILNKHH
jgi:GNAT superfamily N-acetyltransferase